ncbi:MAG: hypothetical protein QTN59_14655 [Candidatus Electrothrix communis]|nr:MAG: hypothetical protein QTN59_14655 [Candidatus Electrothrix communis]
MENKTMILNEQDLTMLNFKSKQVLIIIQKNVHMQVSQRKIGRRGDRGIRSGSRVRIPEFGQKETGLYAEHMPGEVTIR